MTKSSSRLRTAGRRAVSALCVILGLIAFSAPVPVAVADEPTSPVVEAPAPATAVRLEGSHRAANGVQAQDFQHGVIADNNRNATILTGPISKEYFSVGGYTSVLGFPTEYRGTTGLKNGGATKAFECGAIVWSPKNGAFVSKGAIRAAWLKTGAQNGKLGHPITDEITFSGGVKQYFEGGVIVWTAKTGAVVTLVPPHAFR